MVLLLLVVCIIVLLLFFLIIVLGVRARVTLALRLLLILEVLILVEVLLFILIVFIVFLLVFVAVAFPVLLKVGKLRGAVLDGAVLAVAVSAAASAREEIEEEFVRHVVNMLATAANNFLKGLLVNWVIKLLLDLLLYLHHGLLGHVPRDLFHLRTRVECFVEMLDALVKLAH